MTQEKHGVICELPLTCGTCGHVGKWVYLRWCASCGNAICPTCYPPSEEHTLGRCAKCLAENRPTGAELAGRTAAMEREKRALEAITKEGA